jgi:hypothetical protein
LREVKEFYMKKNHESFDRQEIIKNQIARLTDEIRLAEAEVQNAAEEVAQAHAQAAVAKWNQDGLDTLLPVVVEFLRDKCRLPDLEVVDLTVDFLQPQDKGVMIELWHEMGKGGFAFNPACPDELKDQRPGKEGKLIGTRDKKKSKIVDMIVSALDLPE